MGNQIEIRDRDLNLVAKASHGLACAFFCEKTIRKYIPDYSLFTSSGDFNKELEPFYMKALDEDLIVLHIFLNDVSDLEQSDICVLEIAILMFPEKINQNPKEIMIEYLALLKQYGKLQTKLVGVTAPTSIKEVRADGHVIRCYESTRCPHGIIKYIPCAICEESKNDLHG